MISKSHARPIILTNLHSKTAKNMMAFSPIVIEIDT